MKKLMLQEFGMWFTHHSKDPEERRRIRDWMTNHYKHVFNTLIKLAKGQAEDDAFYSSFLHQNRKIGIPNTASKVRAKLQKAWWVEEEDIKQFLLMVIWKHKFTTMSNIVVALRRYLRDHLIDDCRVFSRQIKWERRYKYYIKEVYLARNSEHGNQWLRSLLNKKDNKIFDAYNKEYTVFEKYLIYLNFVLRVTKMDISKMFGIDYLSMFNYINKLKNKVKRLNHGSSLAKRYSKGLSAKRMSWTRTRKNKYPWPSINI